jgi:hypothetical protein
MAKEQFKKTYSTFTNDEIINRAEQVRRDNDVIKTPAVTIYDCDFAILSYLRDEVQPQLIENSQNIDVPVMFVAGEKWAQVQSRGFMRDAKGKMMTPLISIRRSSVIERDTLKSLAVNKNPEGMELVHENKFTKVNKYDRFSILQGIKPVREYHVSPIPEFVDISYELLIWTEYTEQMNKLIEQLIPLSGFAWGTTWKFISFLQDAIFETINSTGEDRLIRATIPLTTKGILLAESELRKSNLQKRYSVKKVVFSNETEKFAVNVSDNPPNGYVMSAETNTPYVGGFEDIPGNIVNHMSSNQGEDIISIKGIVDLHNRRHV